MAGAVKIFFLHIPKTAGQSVHNALVNGFGAESVCPARVNEQLLMMTISQLNSYRIFSGHFDWTLLDCVQGPKYVFTILREPMDRILSFYFFLRDQASQFSQEELDNPSRQGLRAVWKNCPHDYFTTGPPHLRRFLDDHYDNFYAYYFAARSFGGRGQLTGLIRRGLLTTNDVLRMARDNMRQLDAVYTIDEMPKVLEKIRELSGQPLFGDDTYRVNINRNLEAGRRMLALRELGATDDTFRKIEQFCELDIQLWRELLEVRQVPLSVS